MSKQPFRVASYYPDINIVGRNDGGPLYHTQMLRQLFGPENVAHLLPSGDLSSYGKFDLHYWVDFGDDAVGFDKFVCPKPNVYVCSDTHLGFDYRLKKAGEFDWVFCNQERAVEEFIAAGIPPDRCFWLPHAYDPLAYSPGVFNTKENRWDVTAVPLKKYDVCFVGNLNDRDRAEHLDRLFKEFPNFYWGTPRFHEAAEKFNQSKIVFNVSCRDDINMRVFEALGSGSFLLTNEIPTLCEIFQDGVHLVTYKTKDEMIDKASYYLEHDDEREKIALTGHMEALEKHTYLRRVVTVLETIGVQFDRHLAHGLMEAENEDARQNLASCGDGL